MATLQEHRQKRAQALALAILTIDDNFGHVLPVNLIRLDKMVPDDWAIVHPAWRQHPDRAFLGIDFNWLARRVQNRDKIDVGIWCGDELCGLLFARVSRRRINVTLRYLESNPFPNPLSGYLLPVGMIVAESFAEAYGAQTVMVSQPDRALVPLYRSQGYKLSAADENREKRGCKIRAKVLVKRMDG